MPAQFVSPYSCASAKVSYRFVVIKEAADQSLVFAGHDRGVVSFVRRFTAATGWAGASFAG
jgi:hypothetical protein